MSDMGDILTALSTDVSTAVSGVTVSLVPRNPEDIKNDDLPFCILLLTDYGVTTLDWGQEERTWTIYGLLVTKGGTREAMELLLEAIRDEIFSDPTLDSAVDRSTCAPIVPYSGDESKQMFGEFSVQAVKVV